MQKSFKGWLLASDIDGTLIGRDCTIPDENIEAINYFRNNGGIFTLATGRSVESARSYAKKLQLCNPVIVLNGSAHYDYSKERFIYENPLDKNEGLKLINAVSEKFPRMGIEIHSRGVLHIIRASEQVLGHVKYEFIPAVYSTPEQLINDNWHKIFFTADEAYVEELRAYFADYSWNKLYYVNTSKVFVEVLGETANKGTALLEYAKRENIETAHVCAIGDYYNDEQLIEAAGISCYTENAPEDLKSKADYISCHVDKGAVADFIRHIEKLI